MDGGGKSSDGKNAEVTNNGSSGEGSNFGTGGNNGLGGSKGSHSTYAAAGGGGWLTDGEDGVDGRDPTYMDGSGGLSPRNGATGGNNRTQHNPLGGFGGGGADVAIIMQEQVVVVATPVVELVHSLVVMEAEAEVHTIQALPQLIQ